MEKSIVYGLDYYISQMPGAEETDAKSCSPPGAGVYRRLCL